MSFLGKGKKVDLIKLAIELGECESNGEELKIIEAKGNRTILVTYFLSSAGLVLDVKNTCWYFWDNSTHKYPFGEELDTPSIVEMPSNTC
ncbi:hypothetical protein TNCV_5020931 [Trichonephila clavipes]|nr:hypothetical protein TNCV_5020931 [Trichonephila clavipes]